MEDANDSFAKVFSTFNQVNSQIKTINNYLAKLTDAKVFENLKTLNSFDDI